MELDLTGISEGENLDLEVQEKAFWNKKTLQVYDLYLEGESIDKIREKTGLKKKEIKEIITNPIFQVEYKKEITLLKDKIETKKLKILDSLVSKLFESLKDELKKAPVSERLKILRDLLKEEKTLQTIKLSSKRKKKEAGDEEIEKFLSVPVS